MEKKVYVSPEIDLSIVIAENFLSSSDEIILPPHEFKIF